MNHEPSVRYVGDPDLHDATISSVERRDDNLTVVAQAMSGRSITVRFSNVRSVTAHRPEGMMLYALIETRNDDGRRFVFVNWDDDDDAGLQVIAGDFICHTGPSKG